MIWIEKKYINIVGASLRNFVWRSADVAQFSCPYCGDSEVDERKARGYIYLNQREGGTKFGYEFHCHNCSTHRFFSRFLRERSEHLYSEYRLEKFKEERGSRELQEETRNPNAHAKVGRGLARESETRIQSVLGMKSLAELDPFHPSVQYARSRKIPTEVWNRLFFSEDYKGTVLAAVTDEAKKEQYSNIPSDSRLVLPLRTREREVFGFIGRRLSESQGGLRYITLKLDDAMTKIYGLEYHDPNQKTFVMEGAIDSLFLPNALALCGGSCSPTELKNFVDVKNTIICLDNEPRHKDTLRRMKTFIDAGFTVTIWKGFDERYKDINKMFEVGALSSKEEAVRKIEQCSFSGMEAEIEFINWKKA